MCLAGIIVYSTRSVESGMAGYPTSSLLIYLAQVKRSPCVGKLWWSISSFWRPGMCGSIGMTDSTEKLGISLARLPGTPNSILAWKKRWSLDVLCSMTRHSQHLIRSVTQLYLKKLLLPNRQHFLDSFHSSRQKIYAATERTFMDACLLAANTSTYCSVVFVTLFQHSPIHLIGFPTYLQIDSLC